MTNEENEEYLFDQYIAGLRRWRINKLLSMERQINDMVQNELARRIRNDATKV